MNGTDSPSTRRVMTSTRASSSSGENGIVMMSSTPCSKAASLVFRSPRRVNAKNRHSDGATVTPPGQLLQQRAAADVHIDDGQMGLPLGQHGGRCRDVRASRVT